MYSLPALRSNISAFGYKVWALLCFGLVFGINSDCFLKHHLTLVIKMMCVFSVVGTQFVNTIYIILLH
jgi:L-cystine uptake protein TcyP (sodium:dicarboxylate symporter family)